MQVVGLCRERLANYSTYYIVENERKDILDQYEEAPQLYSKNFSEHIYKPGRNVPFKYHNCIYLCIL